MRTYPINLLMQKQARASMPEHCESWYLWDQWDYDVKSPITW